jgi:helix-turn-helix protein
MTRRMTAEEKAARKLDRQMHPRKRKKSKYLTVRCADRKCGACIRCIRARSWAEGKYASKAKSVRPDHWPAEQTARLRELAGRLDRRAIAAQLTQEFPDFPRTRHAVAMHAWRNDISLWMPGRSLDELVPLFGLRDRAAPNWWVAEGLLDHTIYAREVDGRRLWRVTDDALKQFMRAHPWAYDATRIQDASLARFGLECQRGDPYLTPADLAEYLDVPSSFVNDWLRRGLVPHRQRFGLRRGHDILIRGRDFQNIAERLRGHLKGRIA